MSDKDLLFIAYTLYASDPRAVRLCEGAAASGYDVEAYCLRQPGRPRRETRNGVALLHSRVTKYQGESAVRYLWTYGAFFVGALLLCLRRLFAGRPHVVYVKNMPNALVFATLPLRLFGVRVVLDIRDSMPEVYESKFGRSGVLWRLLVLEEVLSTRYASHVTCAHEPHRQLCIEHGCSGDEITPIMNLPDEDLWIRQGQPAPDTFVVLYHGLLAPRTGVDLLLQACAKVRRTGVPGLRIQVVGSGDHVPALRRLAVELGVDDILDMSGTPRPAAEMPSVVSRANLLVVPQRGDAVGRIGLPRKLLECVLLEVPAVVSRSPAIEYFFSDEMVRYFTPEDVDELADAILDMARAPARAKEMARRARSFSDRYKWAYERSTLAEILDGRERDSPSEEASVRGQLP